MDTLYYSHLLSVSAVFLLPYPFTPSANNVLYSLFLFLPVITPSAGISCSFDVMLSAIMFRTIPTCDGIHIKITVPKVSLK
eukprot:6178695-Pleurochrysis_carterae.AAC.4